MTLVVPIFLHWVELIIALLEHESFVSLIANFVTTVATEITQSAGQANMTLISKSTQEFYITYLST